MGNRQLCPGCNSYTSDVWYAVSHGDPCPTCGLSADAILEVLEIRLRAADKELKARLEKALVRADRAESEVRTLRETLDAVRELVTYKPA